MQKESNIILNLNKWKDICKVMKMDKDIKVINEIIKIVEGYYKNIKISSKCTNKEKDIDKLKIIIKGIEKKDKSVLLKYKFKFVNLNKDIKEEWDKLGEGEKLKLSKLELNVVYYLLYRPNNFKYKNKVKKELVDNIDYFIEDEKRKSAIRQSKLI